MGIVTLLLLASVPLLGGDLRRLSGIVLRGLWTLPLALGLQVLVITIAPDLPRPFTVAVHLLTYVLAAVFLVLNRHVPGLTLLTTGATLNGVVIALNGGTLPASASALQAAGVVYDPTVFTNSGVLAEPRLAWLGDVFAVPAGVPFANVFSVGDVYIVVGAAWLLHVTCRRRRRSLSPVAAAAGA
jgi:hypothetical protein